MLNIYKLLLYTNENKFFLKKIKKNLKQLILNLNIIL